MIFDQIYLYIFLYNVNIISIYDIITMKPHRLSAPSLGIASRMIDVTPVKEESAVAEGVVDVGGRWKNLDVDILA